MIQTFWRRRRIMAMLAMALLVVQVSAAPAGTTLAVTRKAPYDFGCLAESNYIGGPRGGYCAVPWDAAKRGTLNAAVHPAVGICAFFVVPCPTVSQISDTTGLIIEVDFDKPTRIAASAVVRDLSPIIAPLIGPQACLLLIDARGGSDGGRCRPMSHGGRKTVTASFDVTQEWLDVAPEDTFYLTVWLTGVGKVQVERISYELSPVVS